MTAVDLRCGDAIELLRTLPDCTIDAVVTDPDYELIVHPSIKLWGGVPKVEWAAECLRVLRPGGHLLAFGGSRTYHRLAVAVEDAGFEIRDSLIWLYGGGFPKSHNISKAIDKAAGAEREVTGVAGRSGSARHSMAGDFTGGDYLTTAPATDEAKWDGWGSALKPGYENIVCARKPFSGTLAANVLEYGTGGLNIDACRIEVSDRTAYEAKCASVVGLDSNRTGDTYGEWTRARANSASAIGRWPANVILDQDAAAELDAQTAGTRSSKPSKTGSAMASGMFGVGGLRHSTVGQGDAGGGASRFFTTVDTREGEDSADRRYGDSGGTGFAMLPGQRRHDSDGVSRFYYTAKASKRERPVGADGFKHPTVKPLSLLTWVVRLVTPPGGTVLDPFAGSGTTIEACLLEGFNCIAFDIDPRAIELCQVRIERNRPDAIR